MKARVEREALTKALRTVSAATPKNAARAVLNGVRLEGDGSTLTLTCTSLDFTITATIDAQAEGVTIAPASLLTRLVAAMPAGAVSIEADDMVRVECGDTLAALHPFDVADWPKLDEQDGEPVVLSEDVWRRVGSVVPFAWPDNNRSPLDCIHFGGATAGVTDSCRAALVDLGVEVPECLVPATSLAAVMRAATAPVELTVGKRTASFASGGVTWTTRLTEYGYPSLAQFFDAKRPHHLTFPAGALLESLARLNLLSTNAHVTIARDGDKASLSGLEQGVGSLTDVVPCSGDFDEGISFNARYLAALVEAAATDEVTLALEGRKHTVVDGDGLRLVLMPINPSAGKK